MTTSGSVDFSVSQDDIITNALLENGELSQGDTIDPDRYATAKLRLNSWVKSLMAEGAKLWAMEQATLFFDVGTASYSLGSTGTNCTKTYVQTTLSADSALGDTTLDLTAFAGMSASDNIGIVLDDGTVDWTTISGAPGAVTTIAVGLTSAASSGNVVFTYTTKINRPQRIDGESMYWHSIAGQDTPVTLISRSEYAQLSNKSTQGKVVKAFYDPQLGNGVLYLWPTPDNATDVLKFWYERILEDFDTTTNTPDFAIEWSEALILGLASRLARSSGIVSPQERDKLEASAERALSLAMGYDKEAVSTYFQPDYRY